MSLYGTIKYAEGTYGAAALATLTGEVTWIVQVDWDGDGVFDGTNEATRMQNLRIFRGRRDLLRPSRVDGGSGFEPMDSGTTSLLFEDYVRRYDPYNTASPIYPILPGRKIQISIRINSTGVEEVLFTGWTLDIRPESDYRTVRIEAADGFDYLSAQKITTPYASTSLGISGAIGATLIACNYPLSPGWELNIDEQPVRVFSLRTQNPAQVVNSLADASLGTFFFDARGIPTFYPRSYNSMPTHNIGQAVLHKELVRGQPWDLVANDITVIAHRIIKKLSGVVWNLVDPIAVSVGSPVTLRATYEPATEIALNSYKAYTNINRTGQVLTSKFTVTADIYPSYTDFTISTTQTGYLTDLVLIGRAFSDSPAEYQITDATSEAAYGPRFFTLDSPWLQSRNYAQSFRDILKAFLKDPHKTVEARVVQRPTVQFVIELQDKVALTSAKLDISETFRVQGIEHRWNAETGQDVETTLWLTPYIYDTTVIVPEPIDVEQPIPEEPVPTPVDPGPGGGSTEPDPDPEAAVAVATIGGGVYVTPDFGATSPTWTSKNYTASGVLIDSDVAYKRDLFYAISRSNINTIADLRTVAASTWTSAYAATTLGATGQLMRVHTHPTDDNVAWALAYVQNGGDATKADAYCLKTADRGANWTATLIRTSAANYSDWTIDTYSCTIPEGIDVITRVAVVRHSPPAGDAKNPWAVVTEVDWVDPDPSPYKKITFGGTETTDVCSAGTWGTPSASFGGKSLWMTGNSALTAGERTTLLAQMDSHFGAGTYDVGTYKAMANETARVNVGYKTQITAGAGGVTFDLYVVWKVPSIDAPTAFDVAGNGQWLYVGFSDSIYKSEDGGSTWFALETTYGANDLVVDPQAYGLVYFWDTLGSLRYISGGVLSSSTLLTETPLKRCLRLARAPNSGQLWTITGGNVRKRELGAWTTQVSTGAAGYGLRAYLGSPTRLVYLEPTYPNYSSDAGAAWSSKVGTGMTVAVPVAVHILED